MMDTYAFTCRLRLLRIMKDVSQETLAGQLDMTPFAYAKLERGNRKITIDVLEKAARAFGLKLWQLIAYCEGSMPLAEVIREMKREHAAERV